MQNRLPYLNYTYVLLYATQLNDETPLHSENSHQRFVHVIGLIGIVCLLTDLSVCEFHDGISCPTFKCAVSFHKLFGVRTILIPRVHKSENGLQRMNQLRG